MPSPTFSIITATSGRETLTRTLASLAPQLEDGDELLVARRDSAPQGNATRDELMARATGSHLWWMDDDDVATEDALATIRRAVAADPDVIHIFKMEGHIYHTDDWEVLWHDPVVEFGRVGGTMCVVPNVPDSLGSWVHRGGRGGDFNFLSETLEKLGRAPVFHEEIIAQIRP